MPEITLKQIIQWCRGQLIGGDPQQQVTGVSIDSRALQPGELFVALKGERHDAHDFINKDLCAKAGALLVRDAYAWACRSDSVATPMIAVLDTLTALQEVSRHYRLQHDVPGVAVTGSNGKTTTKDLIARVLGATRSVHATRGNLNNHIGLPLTLLGLENHHHMLVVELGMNHPGEIDQLAALARPQVGVITNVGPVHLEFMGTLENVYAAKLELAGHVQTLFVNGDDPQLLARAQKLQKNVRTFGFGEHCDFVAHSVQVGAAANRFSVQNQAFEIVLPGRHNIYNALGAIAVARYFGDDWGAIADALNSAKITGLRSEVIRLKNLTILNDSYNANPQSMRAALQMLREYEPAKRRVAVLGDMFELGETALQHHYELGQFVAELKIDALIAIGAYAQTVLDGAIANSFDKNRILAIELSENAAPLIRERLEPDDVVLIKGSRGMKMERLVQALTDDFQNL